MNISHFTFYLLIVLFLSSCTPKEPAKQKEHPPLTIQVDSVLRMDIIDSIQIYGVVKLREEAFLASQFDGRLKDFNFLRGDNVEKDQKIGIIVPPLREALNQTIGDMNDEQRELVENEINEIPLFSPISGTVLEVLQHNGDVLQKGESILHIVNLNQLDIYGDLPVAFVPQSKKLKRLQVVFVNYPHKPLLLPISSFDAQVDFQKQTIQIRLALNNPKQEFRPGMMVKLIFPDKMHFNSLVVPRPALLEEEGVNSVFIVKNGQVEKREVKTGIKHDDFVEILSGVEMGEVVAVQKAYSLTDGMKINVK